ncbi:MAG: TIGR00282 family metallophosphoesterase [Patescibacteria group bacterium]|nr:TIGR00282 family metallophosphoesterase [Patescibacteria group bacterium]
MKILFIGDIFGRPGRETVKRLLPNLKAKLKPNLIIANGENLSHGKGLTPENVKEMQDAGVDFFTSGNHVWKNKKGVDKLDDPKFPVIRPANYPPSVEGRGYEIIKDNKGNKVLVINLLGRVFMKDDLDCPFRTAAKILEETINETLSAIIVDIHAEATSEKVALGHFLDGKVSAVLGTHTHIPTADARVLDSGTAYITDIGMVGPRDSVIGLEKETIVKQFLTQTPVKHEVAESENTLCAVLIEIDPETAKAKSIEHIIDVV